MVPRIITKLVGWAVAIFYHVERTGPKLPEGPAPTVVVRGTVHAGVEIYIRGAYLLTESTMKNVVFRYDPQTMQVVVGRR